MRRARHDLHRASGQSAPRSYTGGAATVSADGTTRRRVLSDLERRFPGMRFRMIDEQQRIRAAYPDLHRQRDAAPDLQRAVAPRQSVHLLCALSGG